MEGMRTITTAQRAVYQAPAGSYATHFRAYASNDGGSTWHNLRELAGRDWLLGATWEETIDQGVTEAHLMLVREQGHLSLAPDMESSALNNLTGSYLPLLQRGYSQVRIEAAVAPLNHTPDSGEYLRMWEGYVCGLADGGEGVLDVFCRDLGGWPLVRTFIENELPYGDDTSGVDVEVVLRQILSDNYTAPGYSYWQPGFVYGANSKVVPRPGHATGYYYVTSAGGTSGGTEPTWPTTNGTFSDGSVTWSLTVASQEYLLYTPTSPTWVLGRFAQQMENVWTALETLSLQLGWHLRYWWDNGTSAFRLTFFEPDRDKAVADFALSTYHRKAVPSWGGDVDDIRNRVRVSYYDKGDLDAAGNPKLKSVVEEDTASQATYGIMFMHFTPGATANIDTSAEATTLAQAALSDLSQPPVDVELECSFLHYPQLGDLVTVPADGAHHDASLDMAVTKVSHRLSDMKASTTLSLRGQPMVARSGWLVRQGARGNALILPTGGPEAVTGVTITPTAAGVAIAFTPPLSGRLAEEYELHLSTSSSFTPDSTTFRAKGKQTTFYVNDLDPGATYYVQIVPREKGALEKPGVRGTASSESSFTTRYVEPRALQPRVTYSALPLNSDFEAANTPGAEPDNWAMLDGAWGTDFDLTTDANSGTNAVVLGPTSYSEPVLGSDLFVVYPGVRYAIRARFKSDMGTGTPALDKYPSIGLRWYSDPTTVDSENSYVPDNVTPDVWGDIERVAAAPSGAKFARVVLSALANDPAQTIIFDSVSVDVASTPLEEPVLPTLLNSFTTPAAANIGSAQHYKDAMNQTCFRGSVTRAGAAPSSGTVIFNLPAALRPSRRRRFAIATDSGPGLLGVELNGDVTYISGGVSEFFLDGVSFRVDDTQ